MNVNETERKMYSHSLKHLAKELIQNQPDFFPEYLCCSYQDFCQGLSLSQNFRNKMQNVTRSYTSALNGNTRAVQHISTVNHWLRDIVCHVSVKYTAFTAGQERIKKIEGEVVARDRARAITTASEQAVESLATLKETSEEAFKKKYVQARQGPGLSPAAAALLEAKKAAKSAQLEAAKARKAAYEAKIETDKEHNGLDSCTLPLIQPSKPLPMNPTSLNHLQPTSKQQQQHTKRKRKRNKGKNKH
jgi:hypothetical protein